MAPSLQDDSLLSLGSLLSGDSNDPSTPKPRRGLSSMSSEPVAKRVCLRHYDLIQHQCLNSMGRSGVQDCSLEHLWGAMMAGHKGAEHCSNLCFSEPYRHNVGLSQLCDTVAVAITQFRDSPEATAIFKGDILEAARQEGAELLPHLQVLDCGRRSPQARASGASVAYYALQPTPAAGDVAIRDAAKALYAWLTKPKSVLRAMLAFLSGGGAY